MAGLLGVIAAMALYRPQPGAEPFLQVMDVVAPCVPTGPGRGARIGNFINGELFGRVADPSVAMGNGCSRRTRKA